MYDGLKTKAETQVDVKAEETSEAHPNESSSPTPPLDATQIMDPNPEVAHWPPSSRPDVRDLNTEIDLA